MVIIVIKRNTVVRCLLVGIRELKESNESTSLRRCETLWSAREIASMALSAEQARHTENVFHIALSSLTDCSYKSKVLYNNC